MFIFEDSILESLYSLFFCLHNCGLIFCQWIEALLFLRRCICDDFHFEVVLSPLHVMTFGLKIVEAFDWC